MTIQTYPKNFANLNVPEPPRGAVLVNLADVEAWLKDSTAMHSNILRGDIALTREQAIHIAGLPADIEAQLVAANRKIAEQEQLLNRCREDINRMQQKYEPFAVLKDGIWPDESFNAPARAAKEKL